MAITASDLELRYSGGATNDSGDLSIGGVIGTEITTDTLNNDMNDVTSAEASAGVTLYRVFYYKNGHATLSLTDPKIFISSQTSSADTAVSIALASQAKNVAVTALSSETTDPPVAITFSSPANYAAGISIGDLEDGDYRGFYTKYVVDSGASAVLDSYSLSIQGDTAP